MNKGVADWCSMYYVVCIISNGSEENSIWLSMTEQIFRNISVKLTAIRNVVHIFNGNKLWSSNELCICYLYGYA